MAIWWVVVWLVCGTTSATPAHAEDVRPPAAAVPQEAAAKSTCPHVRGIDRKATQLLLDGVRLSPTFHHLVEMLEESDVIAWVETDRREALPGRLMLLSSAGGWRHVRIEIRTPGLDRDLIPWLAHELQHAVEIASAPDVRSQDALRQLYARIGSVALCGDNVESREAEQTWLRVRYEVGERRNAPRGK